VYCITIFLKLTHRSSTGKCPFSRVRTTPADNFKFKKNLIENDGVAFLFEKHVLNMCLFFQEAHESTQDCVNKLVDKGLFDHSRWKLLKAMHIVFPKEHNVQGYLVRHAHTPHYMRLFHEFCEAFSAFPGSMEIHIYCCRLIPFRTLTNPVSR
jgi:hypothetical protein